MNRLLSALARLDAGTVAGLSCASAFKQWGEVFSFNLPASLAILCIHRPLRTLLIVFIICFYPFVWVCLDRVVDVFPAMRY